MGGIGLEERRGCFRELRRFLLDFFSEAYRGSSGNACAIGTGLGGGGASLRKGVVFSSKRRSSPKRSSSLMKELGAVDPNVLSELPVGQLGYAHEVLLDPELCEKLSRSDSDGETGKPIEIGADDGDEDGVDCGDCSKYIVVYGGDVDGNTCYVSEMLRDGGEGNQVFGNQIS